MNTEMTQTKKFIISFPRRKNATFFELAKKQTLKKKGGKSTRLSQDIDKILYGTEPVHH
jgi:hypothetical protein